ncbi:MAG: hypothetical protein ACRD4Q_03830 [Candidatus Acidiferrales bacterium]
MHFQVSPIVLNQENLNVTVTAQNQIGGYSYDLAGNLTSIPSVGSFTYNAKDQLSSTAGVTYLYEPFGMRAEKSSGTTYWYGPTNQFLEEADLSGGLKNEYVYFGGQRAARLDTSGNTFYFLDDHLGTSRVVAEVPSGSSTATMCYDADQPSGNSLHWSILPSG